MDKKHLLARIKANLKMEMCRKGLGDAELSKLAGLGRTFVHDLKTRDSIPGLDKMLKLSDALDIPLERLYSGNTPSRTLKHVLSDLARQQQFQNGFSGPDAHEVARMIADSDGDLRSLDQIRPMFELWAVPGEREERPAPLYMGCETVASFELRLRDHLELDHVLDIFEDQTRLKIAESHKRTARSGAPVIEEHECIARPAVGCEAHLLYDRLHALVKCPESGRDLILNYAHLKRRMTTATKDMSASSATEVDQPIMERGSVFRQSSA